nr:membrane protein insertase YidC [Phytoactinopolyspora mesophila]
MLTPLLGTGSAAGAIIVLTIAIRLILTPFGFAQVRAEQHRLRLAPQVRDLKRRYQHNRQKLQQEITKLYTTAGTSPLAGCLPTLAKAPVFTVVYGLFLTDDIHGRPNDLLEAPLAGVPLGLRFADAAGTPDMMIFALLIILLGVVAWASVRLATAAQAASPDMPGGAVVRYLPYATMLIAGIVPLAAGLYLLTTTAWTAMERALFRRFLTGSVMVKTTRP